MKRRNAVTTKSEEDKIVRDGESVRVPLLLMDELQRSVRANSLHDGMGTQAGYKPGFVFVAGRDETIILDAYDEYEKYTTGAWRGDGVASGTKQSTADARSEYVARV